MNGCFFQHFSKVYGKNWLFFLNTGKRFFVEFHLKVNRKSIGYFEIEIFEIALQLALQNNPIGMILCDNDWKFWAIEINFLKKANTF